MKNLIKIGLSLALVSASSAYAGLITAGNTTASGANQFLGFERVGPVASSELLTNQFSGVTFSGTGGGPTLHSNNSCRPSTNNFSGSAWASIGVVPSCQVGGGNNFSTMSFDQDLEELSFDYTTNNNGRFQIEALLNGAIVTLGQISRSSVGLTTTVLLTGDNFDTLRFRELGASNSWFWMDNVNWRTGNNVPEPGTLGLLALGLIGMGLARRKRA